MADDASGGDAPSRDVEQIRRLEQMLRSSDQPETGAGAPNQLDNLPLWRIQHSLLPGMQEILHVHVPHYVHMFQSIMAGPRPWRFGHIFLPDGSRNLGSPEYALEPRTRAPLTGTLAEILHCDTMKDGRMLLLIAGIGRIRVVRSRQALPFSRADVEMWADEEEVVLMRVSALKALDAASQALQVMAMWQLSGHVASAAASAAAKAWTEWEMGEVRAALAVAVANIEKKGGPVSSTLGSLIWQGAMTRSQGGAPSGAPLATGPEELMPLPPPLPDGTPADREVIMGTVSAAWEGATEAAARALNGGAASPNADELLASPIINSCADRAVNVNSVSAVTQEEIADQMRSILWAEEGSSNPWAEVVGLEALTWRTLDLVLQLRDRVGLRPRSLPTGLQMLRPGYEYCRSPDTQPDVQGSPSTEIDPEDLALGCQYSALRRAQRLSYAAAAVLDDVSVTDGRQALLEASSTRARLHIVIGELFEQRNTLQLVLALSKLEGDGGRDIPVE